MRGFIVKEFYHIFRDVRSMVILFGMPVVQILIFGFAITTEITDAEIAILDLSKDQVTREITNKLVASDYFIMESDLQSYQDIEEYFKQERVKEVVIFENDFDRKLKNNDKPSIQIIADASNPNTATLLINYTAGILADYQQTELDIAQSSGGISTTSTMLYNKELKGVFMFVPGIITILLMLVCAMMTSISIAREKELGTMEVLLVSPLRPIQIIVGKVVPYVLLSFINAVTILLLGYFVFGVPVRGSLVLLLAESIVFIILALSLGVFISTVSKTQQVALLISLAGLMLPNILLSGNIFPIEDMPVALQILSNAMPPRWFIIIIKSIMLKGVGLAYIWKETVILFGMIAFFTAISIKKFKIRLE